MVNHTPAIVNCIVPGCENTSISCPEKTFFCVSNSEEKYQHWLLVCKREDLLHKNNDYHEFAVCSDHFVEDHFENNSYTALKDTAVPTLFPSVNQDFICQSTFNIDEASEVYIKSEEENSATYELSENEFDNTTLDEYDRLQNVQKLCRLCANVADNVVYLFSSVGQDLNLAKKINTSLPVTVHSSDPLPKQLCSDCVIKVNMCYEFSEMSLVAEEKLVALMKAKTFLAHRLNNVKSVPEIVTSEFGKSFSSITVVEGGSDFSDNKSVVNIRSKFESVQSILGNIDRSHEDLFNKDKVQFSCPLCPDGTVSIQDGHLDNINNGNEFDENNDMSKDSKCLVTDKKTEIVNENMQQDERNLSSCEADFKEESCEVNDNSSNCSVNEDEKLCGANSSKVANSLEDCINRKCDDKVKINAHLKDLNIICCCICQEPFNSLNLCLNHSKVHFNDDSYPCVVCNKIFSSVSDHTQHCREHILSMRKLNYKGKRLKCDFCEKRFNTQRTYLNHSCASSDAKQFRCDNCKKSFGTQERLLFHQRFHEGARANYCEQCSKEFDNEGSLYYHTRMVHDGERPFSCNLCGKKFYSNSRLMAHKRVHTGERPFQCEVCGRRFYDRDTLKGHYVTHMAMKPFQCDFCGVCWSRKSLLNQHIRTHHSDDSGSRRVQSLIHYYCKICDVTFTTSTDVLMHRTTHWKANPSNESNIHTNAHVCEYCDESFSLVTLLVKHRKQKHPDEKPYICSLCNVSSHTLYEARLHRNMHSTTKEVKAEESKEEKSTFVCESCGNIFTEKRRFMRHIREHKVNLSYKCQTCGKQFIDNQRLTVHTRLHTGEKPFICSVCGKKFSQTSALYTHALLHTGEKPHSCDLCGKAFRIKADRDNHRRTHTGEKPYKCEFCDKSFRTGQVYYQHRMIHTGERRFPCNICHKAFKRSHTLVVHKRIHTGEKPNICDICGKGFRQRSDMRKHRALHVTAEQVIVVS